MAGIISDSPGNQNHTGRRSGGWVLFIWLAPVVFFASLFAYQNSQSELASNRATKTAPSLILSTPTPTEKFTEASPSLITEAATSLPVSNPTATSFTLWKPTPELLKAHLSYYWPDLGGMNCDYECEHLANGDTWQKWKGKGVACPKEYPLGTVFIIMGDEWECVDRGNAVVTNPDESIWLDMLTPYMPYGLSWGAVKQVEVIRSQTPALTDR